MINSSHIKWLKNSNSRVLPKDDAKQVFHLLDKLDLFVGETSGIFEKAAAKKIPVDIDELRKEVRDHWYENSHLIDQFITIEGSGLSEEQKNIVLSWKQRIFGEFICIKYYKNYAIFAQVHEDSSIEYYAALAINDDFNEVLPFNPPYMLNVGLLPYKDVIIWDGLVQLYPVHIGSNMKKSLNDEYQEFKRKKKAISKLT